MPSFTLNKILQNYCITPISVLTCMQPAFYKIPTQTHAFSTYICWCKHTHDFNAWHIHPFLLPPANEVSEGYVSTGVCLSRGGVCPIACWDTLPPPGADKPPPRSRHPLPGSRHPPPPHPRAVYAGRYGQQAGGTHPTGMHTCFIHCEYM